MNVRIININHSNILLILYFAFQFQKHLPCILFLAVLHTCWTLPFSARVITKETPIPDSGSRKRGEKHASKVRNKNWEERSFPLSSYIPPWITKLHVTFIFPICVLHFVSIPSSLAWPLSSVTRITETTISCPSCPSCLWSSRQSPQENPPHHSPPGGSPHLPRMDSSSLGPTACVLPPSPSQLCSAYFTVVGFRLHARLYVPWGQGHFCFPSTQQNTPPMVRAQQMGAVHKLRLYHANTEGQGRWPDHTYTGLSQAHSWKAASFEQKLSLLRD